MCLNLTKNYSNRHFRIFVLQNIILRKLIIPHVLKYRPERALELL